MAWRHRQRLAPDLYRRLKRALALASVAMYDAIIAAWDSKYADNRPDPASLTGR
jgi:hypothetical protein